MTQRWRISCSIGETWIQSLGQKDALEEEVAIHRNILTWKILWSEDPDGLQSKGLHTIGLDWVTEQQQHL